jgi:hypothetical protein
MEIAMEMATGMETTTEMAIRMGTGMEMATDHNG